MAEEKTKTEKYVVTRKNCLNHKVGAVIELDEKKAKSLIGKIRKQSEDVDENALSTEIGKVQAESDSLKSKNKELTNEVKRLKAEITASKKDK